LGELKQRRLLARAAEDFQAFVTVDQNIQFQQNFARIPIAAAILISADNRYETLVPFAPTVLRWLSLPPVRQLVRIYSDGRIERV
jgi:hypothetical protein